MTRRSASLIIPTLFAMTRPVVARAQGQEGRISPHDTVSLDLSGNSITITYGRPYLKGRELGKQVAPFGSVWRLGADEATKLIVTAPVRFEGGPQIAIGSYSLWAITGPSKWTMIVNKQADTWGTRYDQSQDLARFDLNVEKLSSPVEEFTITLEKGSDNTAKVTFAWGKESVSTKLKTS
jgi:DUF2911 family protein